MADLTITAANVVAASDVTKRVVTAGEEVTQGQLLYLKAADNKYWKTDCDGVAAEPRQAHGIALSAASADQPVVVAYLASGGNINLGATLSVGKIYVGSATAGGIRPVDDLVATQYPTIVGIATTTSNLRIGVVDAGTAAAADVT
jgi:hypothetical protein